MEARARAVAQVDYAIAVGCIDTTSTVTVTYRTISDGRAVQATGCSKNANLDTVYVTVDLQHVPAGDKAQMWFGGVKEDSTGSAPVGFDVHQQTVDVFARSYQVDNNSGQERSTRLFRGPSVSPTANQAFQFDLGGQGKPPETHVVTFTGTTPNQSATVDSGYITKNSNGTQIVEPRRLREHIRIDRVPQRLRQHGEDVVDALPTQLLRDEISTEPRDLAHRDLVERHLAEARTEMAAV